MSLHFPAGYWSGVSVCIKIGVVDPTHVGELNDPLVEAQLCTQLNHPCVVQTFAGEYCTAVRRPSAWHGIQLMLLLVQC